MDNQEEFDDGMDHSLQKRTVKEFFDKLFAPWCKAFPKTLGCPKPEEPAPAPAPPASTPTPTPAPAPIATQPPAVVAPPPVETKPASPPVATQPPVVVAPPATSSHSVVKSSSTSITPQPTKAPEHVPVSNPGSGSGGGLGGGSGSGGADGNAGNGGNGGSGSGHGNTGPVGSDNGNNAAVPPPNVTTDREAQPTATSVNHIGNGIIPGKVLLAAPDPAATHSSESGGNTDGDEGGVDNGGSNGSDGNDNDGGNGGQDSQPSPTSHHSAIQHNDQSIPTTLSTAWISAGTPASIAPGSPGAPGDSTGTGQLPEWNPELNPTPGSTHTETGGNPTTSETPGVDAHKTSSTGLVSGIAGGIVSKSSSTTSICTVKTSLTNIHPLAIVVLFLVLFILLFKYRRHPKVQNFLIKYTPLKVAAYTKRDKKRSSMGKGLLYEDEPSSPTTPTMQEKGKAVNYGTILPAPVTQPNPTACRSPTKTDQTPPPLIDTSIPGAATGAGIGAGASVRSPRSPTPDGCGHSMFERSPTGMSDYFPQPPSPTHSNHSRDARNSVDSLGGVSIASSGIFSPSMGWPVPPSTADSATVASSKPSTSHSQVNPFHPLEPTPPMPGVPGSQRYSLKRESLVLGLKRLSLAGRQGSASPSPAPSPSPRPWDPKEGQAGPSQWDNSRRDSRPDSWGRRDSRPDSWWS